MKNGNVKNIIFYSISTIICLLVALLGFYYKFSFVRLIESFKDLGLSVAYYFCELLYIPYSFDVSVTSVSSSSSFIVEKFKLIDFSNFGTYFSLGITSFINGDNFSNYFTNFLFNLSNIIRVVIFLIPIFILIRVRFKKYYTENDNKDNEDSKQLKRFKSIEKKIFIPIKNVIVNYYNFLINRKYFIIIVCCLFGLYFNIFTIIIEFFAYYFYFVISFDFISLFVQLYKLVVDLMPMLKSVPLLIWLIIAIKVLNKIRKNIALDILNHNEFKNRGFINSIGQVSMICSSMGKGKTTLLTDMVLSQEVMFRDKAYELLLENDLKFPNFPYIVLEREFKKAIEYHQVYNLASAEVWLLKKRFRFEKALSLFEENKVSKDYVITKCFNYDFFNYGLYYYNSLKEIYLFDMLKNYVKLYFVYIIKSSLLVSNYGIRVDNLLDDLGNFPIWHNDFFSSNQDYMSAYSRHSHILDFDMLRLGKKVLENNVKANAFEFGIVVITEGGKERKNTLELKEVKQSDSITNQKNDLFNLWLKMARHSATIDNFPFIKVLIDEQRPESMGADVRELCEKIIFIDEKKDVRTPLMFFYGETIIYEFLKDKFDNCYCKYRFFRHDNTLFVYLFKNILTKYFHYYERLKNNFSYNELIISSEKGTLDNVFKKSSYYLSHKKIYSDRFSSDCFSDFFVEKSLNSIIGIDDISEYELVKANFNELDIQNSYFVKELKKNFNKGGF